MDPGEVSIGGAGPSRASSVISNEVAVALVSDLAPVVVGILDVEETVIDVGGALLPRLGYRREDWVGRPLAALIGDAHLLGLIRRAVAGEDVETTMMLNGRRWLVAARPARSGTGEVTGAVVVLAYGDEGDVHRELTAQEALNEQFAALIELSGDFIAIADLDGTVTYVNRHGRDLVGLSTDEECLGRPTDDYFTDLGRAMSHDIEESVRLTGSWQGESQLRHFGTGEAIPVSVNSFLVTRSSDGRPLALATVQRDLRGRLRAERELAVRVQEQRAIAELGRLALTTPLSDLMDEAVRLIGNRYPTLVAGVLHRLPDGRRSQMVSSSLPGWSTLVVPVDRSSLTGISMLDNRLMYTDDVRVDDRFRAHGTTTGVGMRSTLSCPIPGSDGQPWGAVGASGDLPYHWTEDDLAFVESVAATLGAAVRRDELEARLQHQALHDPLTGLPNRPLVLDRIDHALARATRQGSMTAVLLLDVDDFKAVNDSLGHGSGDDLLADLALRLRDVVREDDTIARLGGDEFVVVCEEVGCQADVAFLAESLLEACASRVEIGGRRLTLSASIGVAISASGAASTTSMLSEADIAMYRAKRDRPGTYRIFDEAMRGDALGRINVAGDLRAAVRAGQIEVAFQPIVDLASGRVVAMEALARWTDEAGERIPPDLFIPVAEETGIIGELGRLVLGKAVREAAGWQDLGPCGVRVNASAHELRGHQYVDQVLDLVAEAGLDPALLGLEITESAFVDEDKTTQDNLTRLRESGVSLLIDDFGTGYSSLSYLQRFPVVDVLKIDRSFLGEGTRGEAVVQAVIGLGKAFGLQVCAEGVETPEQHARVAALGCDFAQGYLLGRPVPLEEARGVLSGWRLSLPPS